MNRRQFLAGGLGAAIGAAGLISLSPPPEEMRRPGTERKRAFSTITAAERRRRRFPNVLLRTQDGEEVRFYDDLVKDRTVVINFFYTNCVGETICPAATANLVMVRKLLGKRAGRDVFMYSITLDPEHDTPKVLKRYAKAFGAGPGWLFLTGEKENVEAVRKALGEVDPDPVADREKTSHTGVLRFGVEPLERWAACPSLTDPKWIVKLVGRVGVNRAA